MDDLDMEAWGEAQREVEQSRAETSSVPGPACLILYGTRAVPCLESFEARGGDLRSWAVGVESLLTDMVDTHNALAVEVSHALSTVRGLSARVQHLEWYAPREAAKLSDRVSYLQQVLNRLQDAP